MFSVPPAPEVVLYTCVQVVALLEMSMWYAVANAASQWIVNPLRAAFAPRSSCSHWGSLQAYDQRVDWSPSTAAEAGVPAFSTDDAVASEPTAMLVSAAVAPGCGPRTSKPATRTARRRAAETERWWAGSDTAAEGDALTS